MKILPIWRLLPLLWLLVTAPPSLAQTAPTLDWLTPVSGTLAAGGADEWTLNAPSGAVVSLIARATDGALDPVLTVLSGGDVLISNDDAAYPDSRDAALEAISLPRTGSYIVRVSAFGGSSGSYTLTALPGYSSESLRDDFVEVGTWSALSAEVPLELSAADGRMTATLRGIERTGGIASAVQGDYERFYAEMTVNDIRSRGGWTLGLMLRLVGAEGYAVEIDDEGLWRFVRVEGSSSTPLRDWTAHPALVAGQTQFRIAVLAYEDTFEIFYQGQLIGSVRDEALLRPGRFGLMLRTGSTLDAQVSADIETLSVTTPANPVIFPSQLIVSSDGAVMAQELARRGLTRTAAQRLNVGESFVDLARAGVGELSLARGEVYDQFAFGASVTWESGYQGAPSGCGLLFGLAGEQAYTLAYVMQNGDYGLSVRSGDVFAPGLYGTSPSAAAGTRHLLVVALADALHYYVNGEHVGQLDQAVEPGGIGVAVLNDVPVTTTCRFTGLWLAG